MSETMLNKFFEENGWIAGMYENYQHYVHMMADIIGGRVGAPEYNPENCMKLKKTYEYRLIAGVLLCAPYLQ